MYRIVTAMAIALALALTTAPAASAVPRGGPGGPSDSQLKKHHCAQYFHGHTVRGHIAYVSGFSGGMYVFRSGMPTSRKGTVAYCSKAK